MTDRQLAWVAIIIGLVVLVLLFVHVAIPTPPAHTWNPFGVGAGAGA